MLFRLVSEIKFQLFVVKIIIHLSLLNRTTQSLLLAAAQVTEKYLRQETLAAVSFCL